MIAVATTSLPVEFTLFALLCAAVAQVGGVIVGLWNDKIQADKMEVERRQAKVARDQHTALLEVMARRQGVSEGAIAAAQSQTKGM